MADQKDAPTPVPSSFLKGGRRGATAPDGTRYNYDGDPMRAYYAEASAEIEQAFATVKALVGEFIHRHPMCGGLVKMLEATHGLVQQELMRQDEGEKRLEAQLKDEEAFRQAHADL